MNDGWARPGGSTEAPIEVPLLDADGRPIGAEHPAAPSPANWRRLIAVATAGGIALGIIAAVVVLTAGDADDDGAPPDTTFTPDDLASSITTPPTLPRPGTEQLTEMDGLSSQDRILFDLVPSITTPQYPNLDLPDELLERYDLTGALDRLAEDVPRRSTTRYEVGEEAYRIVVSITRDVVRDRYEIRIDGDGDGDGGDARLVVDVAEGLTYVSTESDDESWTTVPNDELDGDANLATMIGRLLRGPVRADTVRSAVLVTPGPAVTIRSSAPIARRFAVTLRAGQVPEWARYQLGAVADAPPPDPDDPIGFFAYVSEGDDIVEVGGTFPFGNTEQLVVHRIEALPGDFEIELPEVEPGASSPTTDESADSSDRADPSDSTPATTAP